MIHDALLVLWDCSVQPDKTKLNHFSNDGDSEIISRVYDIARIHHRIQNYIEETSFYSRKTISELKHRNIGLYSQALSEGMSDVIQVYKQTLIEVEKLMIENHTYTLSFIYSHVEKYRSLFITLNKIISTLKERKLTGCQILSYIHQHILTGNPMVHDSVIKMFSNINQVFINQLCSWLLYGELRDPYQDFFIHKMDKENISDTVLSSPSTTNSCDRHTLTTFQNMSIECGYKLQPNMIPYYIPLSLAEEILFIGKTVILFGFDPRNVNKRSSKLTKSFPQLHSVGYNEVQRFTIWEEKEATFHEKLQKLKGPNFETSQLKRVIREIKECVTKHLWFVAVEEAQLLHELKLMKDFYLLGRGELFLELLRLSSHILDKPTKWTSTRDINHAFQLAARSVFLSNSADIDKFTFELPYDKHAMANTSVEDDSCTVADGWSSIILKYNFKWPLHLLFTPEVLARYNDMFQLLLRIKKTQHDLHALWKTYKQNTSFSMCQLHNKLMFLMDNLQHYLQADVLETNFSKLMEAVGKTTDFEKLKDAHATFLADILSQSFLTITTSSENEGTADAIDCINNPVFFTIMDLLKLCHSFCNMTETVSDRQTEDYYLRSYTERFNKLVKRLMQLLVSFRDRPSGVFLARLLMRLDYNRWLSREAQLTQSVTNMLR